MRLYNATGSYPGSWAADVVAGDRFVGRAISTVEDGVQRVILRGVGREVVAEVTHPKGQPVSQDDVAEWVVSKVGPLRPRQHKGYDLPLAPEHFRALREAAGLSQQELAQWARVADRSVRRWDVSHPAPDEVARFVIDQWGEVLEEAADIAAQGPAVVQTRGTAQGRAVARVVVALVEAEAEGGSVRVVP